VFKIWISKGEEAKFFKGPLPKETLPHKENLCIIQYWSTLGRYKESMIMPQ